MSEMRYLVCLFDVDRAGVTLHYRTDVAAVGKIRRTNFRTRQMLQIREVHLNKISEDECNRLQDHTLTCGQPVEKKYFSYTYIDMR